MMLPEGISVVVPVYNSAATVVELVDRTEKALGQLGKSFEMIMVEDGSIDDSWKQIRLAAEGRPWVIPIRLTRNYGQHNALLCGLRRAQFSHTVTMDDDLQHPPEAIGDLFQSLQEWDVLYGTAVTQQQKPFRSFASTVVRYVLSKTMGTEAARHISAFRIFRTELRRGFSDYQSPFVSIDVLLSWTTSRFSYMTIEHQPRKTGRSNYTFRKLISHTANLITGFSVLPLQVASITGLIATAVGAALLLFLLLRKAIAGSAVPGFTFLASAITLFSGVQLFALGLIGEYLARVHVRSMGRPPYLESTDS